MSRRMTLPVVVLTLSVLVLAGCVPVGQRAGETFGPPSDTGPRAHAPAGVSPGSVPFHLLAAEGGTEAPAPKSTETPESPTEAPAPAAPEYEIPSEPEFAPGPGGRLGVRAGMFVPAAAEDETYSESFTVGVFYSDELGGGPGFLRMPVELGLDAAWSGSEDGRVDAGFYALRFDVLFSKWQALPPRRDFYLLGGYQVVLASLEVDGKSGEGEYVSALNIGLGLGSLEKRWDARLAYSILGGSGNVRGLAAATAGFRF